MKEAATFFVMCLIGLALACAYIEAQGGNPFASAQQSDTDYRSMARQDAVNAGIPPDYFVAQINEESGFNPNAESHAGAIGIAQIMPDTASGLGIDPWNPVQSLAGASQLMSRYYQKYGDYAKALSAYNYGYERTNSVIDEYGVNWKGHIPSETRAYIAIIMGE
ncbi:MAG TPA: transglycosylase SLT domain-containing protein [Patescibacteria group bacterium]